jgi:hypothetical protein
MVGYTGLKQFKEETKNKVFKLTKVKAHNEEDYRQVKIGDTSTGEVELLSSSLILGKMLLVGNIRTSEIQKIEKYENSYVITTKNSLYTLVEENNV